MQDYEEFKERVMAALTASKIPARAIAAGAGLSPASVSRLLAGRVKNPDRSITLNRLAAYFGIPYDREGTGGEGHELVSTKEAAWMLGLSDVTVLNLIEVGALRTVRTGRGPGGRHFISRRAVEEMVPETAPLRDVAEALAKVRDEMESERHFGRLDIEEARQARDAFIRKYYGVEDVAALVGISEYFFERILGVGDNAEKLSEREKSVLRQRLARIDARGAGLKRGGETYAEMILRHIDEDGGGGTSMSSTPARWPAWSSMPMSGDGSPRTAQAVTGTLSRRSPLSSMASRRSGRTCSSAEKYLLSCNKIFSYNKTNLYFCTKKVYVPCQRKPRP